MSNVPSEIGAYTVIVNRDDPRMFEAGLNQSHLSAQSSIELMSSVRNTEA